jgi:hypothetical protein
MLRLYVPVAVTVVLIGALTYWEGIYSDRFRGSSVSAEEFGKRFADVPMEVGDWVGENREVASDTLEVAGAVNHVSRVYKNRSGQQVDLWLVVGHARDIGRHTPDVCYIAQGFSQDGDKLKQRLEVPGEEPATFFTARFRREDQAGVPTRVFWAWNANDDKEKEWVAPDYQRIHFGNNTALYKMYFTSSMPDRDQPVADNAAMDFAKVMLPVVNRALFPERYVGTEMPTAAAAAASITPTAAPKTDETGTPTTDGPVAPVVGSEVEEAPPQQVAPTP